MRNRRRYTGTMWRVSAACELALSCLSGCGATESPQAPTPSAGTPVWQDEFDSPGLPHAGRWDHEVGLIRNNERQVLRAIDRRTRALKTAC